MRSLSQTPAAVLARKKRQDRAAELMREEAKPAGTPDAVPNRGPWSEPPCGPWDQPKRVYGTY